MLSELNPSSMNHLINAGDIGVETVERLQDCIASGGLVVIAGDRTPAHTRNRYFMVPFLGCPAPIAMGPFYLAALLDTEAYFVFALRENSLSLKGEYDMFVYKSSVVFDCPRSERNKRIESLARAFTGKLEEHCKDHPYEWYNFYDFWNTVEITEIAEINEEAGNERAE
jgi:predicted LPLAT superfamily acyltransferase